MEIEKHLSYGTSSRRGYSTVRSGWLPPPNAFLGCTSVRGWPRGGSAESPSTLTTLVGEPLRDSWDRCAHALRAIDAMRPFSPELGSWVDRHSSAHVAAILGSPDPGERHDSRASVLAWILEYILSPWRFSAAMAAYRGDASMEGRSAPGLVRTPEECVEAVRGARVLRWDTYGAALQVYPSWTAATEEVSP